MIIIFHIDTFLIGYYAPRYFNFQYANKSIIGRISSPIKDIIAFSFKFTGPVKVEYYIGTTITTMIPINADDLIQSFTTIDPSVWIKLTPQIPVSNLELQVNGYRFQVIPRNEVPLNFQINSTVPFAVLKYQRLATVPIINVSYWGPCNFSYAGRVINNMKPIANNTWIIDSPNIEYFFTAYVISEDYYNTNCSIRVSPKGMLLWERIGNWCLFLCFR